MTEGSLGVIVPAEVPTRATANEDDETVAFWVHSYKVQHWPDTVNTGAGWVGTSDIDKASGTGVVGYVPPITDAPPWPPYESHQSPRAENPINMANVYIDSENASDGFLVTYIRV